MTREEIEGSPPEGWVSTASAYFIEGVDDAQAEAKLSFGYDWHFGCVLTLRLRIVLEHCFGKVEDSYERGVELVPSKLAF